MQPENLDAGAVQESSGTISLVGNCKAADYGEAATGDDGFLMALPIDCFWDQSCLIYSFMTLAQI